MGKHKQRIQTGFLLAILAIVSVFYFPNALFALLSLAIITAAFWEWMELVHVRYVLSKLFFLFLFFVLLFVFYHHLILTLKIAGFLWLWALLLILAPADYVGFLKSKTIGMILGFVILIPPWIAVVVLHEHDRLVLFYLIMTVSFADTAAYFVGSHYGRRRLIPRISPKKSLEGLVGGLVVGTLAGLLEVVFMPNIGPLQLLGWVLLSVVLIMISLLGDLFESLLKRIHNAKDSGSFLPGHGGVLDRIDSQTSAAPLFLLLVLSLHLIK